MGTPALSPLLLPKVQSDRSRNLEKETCLVLRLQKKVSKPEMLAFHHSLFLPWLPALLQLQLQLPELEMLSA